MSSVYSGHVFRGKGVIHFDLKSSCQSDCDVRMIKDFELPSISTAPLMLIELKELKLLLKVYKTMLVQQNI